MEKDPQEKGWYERILEKPPAYRKRLTFILVALAGFLIVSVWIFITSYQIRKALQGNEPATIDEANQDNLTLPTEANQVPASLQDKNEIFKDPTPGPTNQNDQ